MIRPPGHHSSNEEIIKGFCFLNNVAIGAYYLKKKRRGMKKVAILDFDVHAADGTQSIFV